MLGSQRSLYPRLLGHWLLLGTLLVTGNSRALAGATLPDWRVGVASVGITPTEPVLLSGYSGRNKPHESVNHSFRAKALTLEDARGDTLKPGFRTALDSRMQRLESRL